MSCRCSEISKLRREISNLKKALTYANNAESSKEYTKNEVKNAATFYESGVIFDGMEVTTAEELRKSYNEASTAISDAKSAISSAISKAESRLSSLESEDDRYHDDDDD